MVRPCRSVDAPPPSLVVFDRCALPTQIRCLSGKLYVLSSSGLSGAPQIEADCTVTLGSVDLALSTGRNGAIGDGQLVISASTKRA